MGSSIKVTENLLVFLVKLGDLFSNCSFMKTYVLCDFHGSLNIHKMISELPWEARLLFSARSIHTNFDEYHGVIIVYSQLDLEDKYQIPHIKKPFYRTALLFYDYDKLINYILSTKPLIKPFLPIIRTQKIQQIFSKD